MNLKFPECIKPRDANASRAPKTRGAFGPVVIRGFYALLRNALSDCVTLSSIRGGKVSQLRSGLPEFETPIAIECHKYLPWRERCVAWKRKNRPPSRAWVSLGARTPPFDSAPRDLVPMLDAPNEPPSFHDQKRGRGGGSFIALVRHPDPLQETHSARAHANSQPGAGYSLTEGVHLREFFFTTFCLNFIQKNSKILKKDVFIAKIGSRQF